MKQAVQQRAMFTNMMATSCQKEGVEAQSLLLADYG